ncbi:MAG TPA: hypothetical protein VHE54_12075 [Puia sp.]|nr:hypothetical protein [Puia sp.]
MATTNIGVTPGGRDGVELHEDGKPLNEIAAGDIDDTTGETIVYVVYSTADFIVTIDKKLSLNWETADGFDGFPADFGEVLSNVELADELVDSIFKDDRTRLAFKKMLGSVIARLLDDRDSKYACKKLAIVEERIRALGNERIRMHYIFASLFTVVAIVLAFLLVRIFKLDQSMPWDNLLIVWSVMLGGVGAFITTFARFQNYTGKLEAGLSIHWLDGFLRIFYGLVAGLIVFYAVKANVLVGFSNDSKASQPWLFYFLAIVAGASEVLVPNLIRQTEGGVSVEDLQKRVKELEQQVKAGGAGGTPVVAVVAANGGKDGGQQIGNGKKTETQTEVVAETKVVGKEKTTEGGAAVGVGAPGGGGAKAEGIAPPGGGAAKPADGAAKTGDGGAVGHGGVKPGEPRPGGQTPPKDPLKD